MAVEKKNLIVDLSFEFALKIIEFAEELESLKKYVIAKQILKSGTSIAANVREAQNAESKADFIHKLKISLKQAEETEYWLLLAKYSKNYPTNEELLLNASSIIKVLTKIIVSSKNK